MSGPSVEKNIACTKISAERIVAEQGRVGRSTYIKASYDFSKDGAVASGATFTMRGDALPAGAVVTRTFYSVGTTFTSATDAATIAIQNSAVANAYVTATAISAVGNVWDAGLHEGIQTGTAANMEAALAAGSRVIMAVAGGEALTAGAVDVYLEYVL